MVSISVIFSILSLSVSFFVLYKTYFQAGKLKMTHPAIVAFTYDGIGSDATAKIFFRTLLFSTSHKGQIIQHMYLKVYHNKKENVFSSWGHEEKGKLVRGSGLFIPKEGVAEYHHFPFPNEEFNFLEGIHDVEVWANLYKKNKKIRLGKFQIQVSKKQAEDYGFRTMGYIYDWNPSTGEYHSTRQKPTKEEVNQLLSQ